MIKSLVIFGLFVAALLSSGCNSSPSTEAQPGDRVLREPMDYRLSDEDFPSVSGGGIGTLDKKGLKRDYDNIINP